MRIDAHQHFWTHSAAEYPWIGPGMDWLARDFGPRRWDEIGEPVEELGDGEHTAHDPLIRSGNVADVPLADLTLRWRILSRGGSISHKGAGDGRGG